MISVMPPKEKKTGIEVSARWYQKNTHVAEGMRSLRPGVEIRPRDDIVALTVDMEAPTASFRADRLRQLRCSLLAPSSPWRRGA